MLVTGTNGVFDIDIADLDYFYVRNDILVFKKSDGTQQTAEFASNYLALLSGREYFNLNWRNLVTVLDTDTSRSYYINVAKITSHSASSDTLTVSTANYTLSITCPDSAGATWDAQYITDVKAAYRFLTDFAGTFRTVGVGKDYATIALANAAASSGECVRIYSGTYSENLTLKNGVYYYFEDGAILAGAVIYAADTAWTSYIYGYGTFRQAGTTSNDHIWKGSITDSTENSKLVFVFKKIETDAPRTIFAGKGKTRLTIKGDACEAYNEASYTSFIDTDSDWNADVDVVSVADCEELSFVTLLDPSEAGARRIVFRNVSCVNSSTTSQINATYNFEPTLIDYQYFLINVLLDNQGNVPYGANFNDYDGANDVTPYEVTIANSIFRAAANEYNLYTSLASVFNLYGYSYATKGGNSSVVYSNPPSMTISSGLTVLESDSPSANINLTIMALTNKPDPSHYQVGHLVVTADTVGLAENQVAITQVRVVMTNPNNDSTGVQENFYKVEGYDKEYTENEIFWSQEHYFQSLLPSGRYVNSSAIADVGNLETIMHIFAVGRSFVVANLAGQDFDSADFVLEPGLSSITWGSDDNDINAVVDGANLANCNLPHAVATLNAFKAAVYSYDDKTIWTDGLPLVR